jgi:hypothetical protein
LAYNWDATSRLANHLAENGSQTGGLPAASRFYRIVVP